MFQQTACEAWLGVQSCTRGLGIMGIDNSVFWGSLQQEHLPLQLLEGFAEPLVLAVTGFPPLAEIVLV